MPFGNYISFLQIYNEYLTDLTVTHEKLHLFFRLVCRRRPHYGFLEVINIFQCCKPRLSLGNTLQLSSLTLSKKRAEKHLPPVPIPYHFSLEKKKIA